MLSMTRAVVGPSVRCYRRVKSSPNMPFFFGEEETAVDVYTVMFLTL